MAFSFLEIYFYPTLNHINGIIEKTVPELKDIEWTPEWAKE